MNFKNRIDEVHNLQGFYYSFKMKLEILLVFLLLDYNLAADLESLDSSPEDISGSNEGSGQENEEISEDEFNNKSVEERLFENVEQGNIEDVQALISSDVDLNLKNNENETLFEIATRLKNVYENISQIVLNQMEDNVIKHLAENRSCLYIIGMSLAQCPSQPGLPQALVKSLFGSGPLWPGLNHYGWHKPNLVQCLDLKIRVANLTHQF